MPIKVTTEDCKQFLAEFFRANPRLIVDLYGDDYALEDAQNPTKWKRQQKLSPAKYFDENDSLVAKTGDVETVLVHTGAQTTAHALADIAMVRAFVLEPATYDTAVMYLVLEGLDGRLYLGEYVGD